MTGKYQLQVSRGVARELRRLPVPVAERLARAIESFSVNPKHRGVKKLIGRAG